jgi:hypothetical protein
MKHPGKTILVTDAISGRRWKSGEVKRQEMCTSRRAEWLFAPTGSFFLHIFEATGLRRAGLLKRTGVLPTFSPGIGE